MRAPGVEAIAAHPLALAGAGSRLPVELDGLDGDFQRPAGHRALHEHGAGCRVDAIPVDLVQLVLGRLHLVAETVLRADAHRGGIDVIPIDLIEFVLGPLHLIAEAILRAYAHRRPRRHH